MVIAPWETKRNEPILSQFSKIQKSNSRTSLDQAKAQFDVNFFGTVNGNKAVLPSMREAGKVYIEKYI